jgi:hypothetical protein
MSAAGCGVLDEEILDRFYLAAPSTPFHDLIVARRGASVMARSQGVARPEGIEPPSFRLEGGCLIR